MQPCFRTSPSRKRKRRSHHALKAKNMARCPNCDAAKEPHLGCPSCGYIRPGLKVKLGGDA